MQQGVGRLDIAQRRQQVAPAGSARLCGEHRLPQRGGGEHGCLQVGIAQRQRQGGVAPAQPAGCRRQGERRQCHSRSSAPGRRSGKCAGATRSAPARCCHPRSRLPSPRCPGCCAAGALAAVSQPMVTSWTSRARTPSWSPDQSSALPSGDQAGWRSSPSGFWLRLMKRCFLGLIQVCQPDLGFPAAVGDEGDLPPLRRPRRAVIGGGMAGQPDWLARCAGR